MQMGLLTIPNLLTLLRIALVPLIAYYIDKGNNLWALITMITAGTTDILDGWIARRWNLQSNFGKLIDPVADKLTLCVMIVFLVGRPAGDILLPQMSATLGFLLLGREFLITGLRAWAASMGLVLPADAMGKIKALCQNFGLGFFLYADPIQPIPYSMYEIGLVLMWVSVGLSYFSMVRYCQQAFSQLRHKGPTL